MKFGRFRGIRRFIKVGKGKKENKEKKRDENESKQREEELRRENDEK